MKVLLLGARGMLATDLAATAPKAITVLPLARGELDITDDAAVARVMRAEEPDVVLNAAAYTDVDGAEREPERAMLVNGSAPGILGRAAGTALVVHYSTDYVFNARPRHALTETDPTNPPNQYGRSKLEGEQALAASGARHLIIRTQWLFGLHGRSFPRTMWERAQSHQKTRVVNDQFGRPTWTVDLASATWRIVESVVGRTPVVGGRSSVVGKSGRGPDHRSPTTDHRLLHVANSGITTWYDVAKRIFRAASADALLEPCTSAEFPRPARRPEWSALDTTQYDQMSGQALPAWEDAVDGFLSRLKSEGPTA